MNDEYQVLDEYETLQLQEDSVVNVDYSNYLANIQTCLVLILACLVAIGCFLGWVGARRE